MGSPCLHHDRKIVGEYEVHFVVDAADSCPRPWYG